MSGLTVEHEVLVKAVYERVWDTGSQMLRDYLPRSPHHVSWVYLRKGSYSRLGWARPPVRDANGHIIEPAMIAIHPSAFKYAWRPVLLGLLNHEMLHLAIPEHGHDEIYLREEQVLPEYPACREWRFKFIDYINEDARRMKGVYVYECIFCERQVESIRKLPEKSSCRHCCDQYTKGRWDKRYTLIYVGRQHPISQEHEEHE